MLHRSVLRIMASILKRQGSCSKSAGAARVFVGLRVAAKRNRPAVRQARAANGTGRTSRVVQDLRRNSS